MDALNGWLWLALYVAAGMAVHMTLRVNAKTLIGWATRLERLSTRGEMDGFNRGAEYGARNAALVAAFTVVAWPWTLTQVLWLWRALKNAEQRAEGKLLSELTRQELIDDLIDERYGQVEQVFADKISEDERVLFTRFAAMIAPCFGEHADDFMEKVRKYKKRSDNAGAIFQLSGGRMIDSGVPEVGVLLSVLVSIERTVTITSTDRCDVDTWIAVSAVSHQGLAITKTEAGALEVSGAVAAMEDATAKMNFKTAREYLGEYWLHGAENPDEQHWHGTLQASGEDPVTDEDKATIRDVVVFFKKIANTLDLNSCQRDDELSLDATIGVEKVGPSA